MIVGVNWHDVDGERVDLDLHLQNDNSHFGWNASYRCGYVVYSGDITSAPEGATEVFWLGKDNINVSYLLSVLCYTQNRINVPFKFFIADCEDSQVERNYMVNPNNIKLMINKEFDVNTDKIYNKTLGMVTITDTELRYYFNGNNINSNKVPSFNNLNKKLFEYTNTYNNLKLTLRELLELCDVCLINKLEDDDKLEDVINLQLESLSKDTLINILI